MKLDFTFRILGDKNVLVCTHCAKEWDVPIRDAWRITTEHTTDANGKPATKTFKTRDSWIKFIMKKHLETHQ